MAILDKRSEFADATACTGTAGATTVLGNVMPLDTAGLNLGVANAPYFCVTVDTAVAATGGAANLTVKLVSDSVSTLDSSPTVHITTGAVAKGSLTAGAVMICQRLPLGTYESYLGVTITPDTNDITSGKLNAYLSMDPPNGWTAYNNAI